MALLAYSVIFVVPYLLPDDTHQKSEQGNRIVAVIKDQVPGVTAYWSPGWRRLTISVYGAIKHGIQDQIAMIVAESKSRGDITVTVEIEFYEREIWITTAKSKKGSLVSSRGNERLIKTIVVR